MYLTDSFKKWSANATDAALTLSANSLNLEPNPAPSSKQPAIVVGRSKRTINNKPEGSQEPLGFGSTAGTGREPSRESSQSKSSFMESQLNRLL